MTLGGWPPALSGCPLLLGKAVGAGAGHRPGPGAGSRSRCSAPLPPRAGLALPVPNQAWPGGGAQAAILGPAAGGTSPGAKGQLHVMVVGPSLQDGELGQQGTPQPRPEWRAGISRRSESNPQLPSPEGLPGEAAAAAQQVASPALTGRPGLRGPALGATAAEMLVRACQVRSLWTSTPRGSLRSFQPRYCRDRMQIPPMGHGAQGGPVVFRH